MGKKILRVYLAKNDTPYSAAYAKLELPASPWELWDAMEKVRLQTDDILYMEIEDYFAFEYLSPHLDGLDISLNELNDLAAQLAALDEVQGIAFEGMFSIAAQRKANANGGVITLQDLRDLAVSAKPTPIMWWMPRMTLSLAASMRKTILSPNWMACRMLSLRCWTLPVSEE